jgi:hypothetical protein
MSSEVSDLIAALKDGSLSLDEVADRFRHRSWPRRHHRDPASYLDMSRYTLQDPDVYLPGSFDEVIAAYQDGLIDDEQYTRLSEAVAEAKRAEDQAGG